MKPLLILNDVHLGVKRMAGTTPASQMALRDDLQQQFKSFIMGHTDKDLCILGDLFDGFEVDTQDVLAAYLTLSQWLATAPSYATTLFLVAGNHDIGKRNDKLSSFGLLCELLHNRYPSRVVVVDEHLHSHGNIHMIPHCMNQDIFDMEMKKAVDVEPGYLLLHANVDNGFAENSDHSLNVDGEWLTRLTKKHVLLFGHEHQHRVLKYDHKPIFVLGNQWPSSVSDCLAHGEAQKDGMKQAHIIHPDGNIEPIMTWCRNDDFVQMPWDELNPASTARFIRVTGRATSAQAADVISAIARYRSTSPAYVITNGVVIEGVQGMDEMAEVSLENVKAFNVMSALLELLTPEERKVIEGLSQ